MAAATYYGPPIHTTHKPSKDEEKVYLHIWEKKKTLSINKENSNMTHLCIVCAKLPSNGSEKKLKKNQ